MWLRKDIESTVETIVADSMKAALIIQEKVDRFHEIEEQQLEEKKRNAEPKYVDVTDAQKAGLRGGN